MDLALMAACRTGRMPAANADVAAPARVARVLQQAIDHLTGRPRAAPPGREGEGDDEARLGAVTLLPHQREGARRLQRALDTYGGALLADEVGTGKTFTALAVARHYAGVRVVAPAALRPTWEEACRRAGLPPAEFVSYERLSAGYRPSTPPPPLLLLDEAHHARNRLTRRYRTLAAMSRGVHVLLLSATPVHNRQQELDALLALFLGAGASRLEHATAATIVVRRDGADAGYHLPALRDGIRHELPSSPEILQRLRTLPPPVPPRDGEAAHALVALQLTRAWCSSDAALLAAIRRRLMVAAALEEALREGRHPARRELALWTGGDDGSVQLAFPSLCVPPGNVDADAALLLAALGAHTSALRDIRALVRGPGARDSARFAAVDRILATAGGTPAIVFTHSAETATAAFAALRGRHRTALLTGRGAWLASGPVPRREVLAAFAPDGRGRLAMSPATRLDVLVATDVVSEGVDLQRAATIVHLDLPWTAARVEQRLGRVRRVGSRHHAVTVHMVAPPAGAEELADTLRLLARKESLAARAVGPSSLLGAAPPWSGGPPPHSPSPGQARQQLIQRLRDLHQRAAAGAASPRHPDAHDAPIAPSARCSRTHTAPSTPTGAPAQLAYWQLPSAERAIAIALVDIDGAPQLLVGDARSLTIQPARALEHVERLLAHARPPRSLGMGAIDASAAMDATAAVGATAGTGATTTHPARTLAAAVDDWCAQRRATRLVALPLAQRSAAHRQLLVALDALPSTMPRGDRARVAARVAAARALVLSQRGAGAEALLQQLVRAVPPPLQGGDAAERWLTKVLQALRGDRQLPRVVASGSGTSHPGLDGGHGTTADDAGRDARLVALLVAGPDPPP
jgi:superfamily II DNA or RNA helicase